MYSIEQLQTMSISELQSLGSNIVDEIQEAVADEGVDLTDLENLTTGLNRCSMALNFALAEGELDNYVPSANEGLSFLLRANNHLDSYVEGNIGSETSKLRKLAEVLKERSTHIRDSRTWSQRMGNLLNKMNEDIRDDWWK